MSGSDLKISILVILILFPLLVIGKTWDTDSLTTNPKLENTKINDQWIAPDKGLHLLGSTILTVGTAKSLQRFAEYNRSKSANISLGIVFSIGIGKELSDRAKPQNIFSFKDLTADLLGCCLGYLLLNID